MTTTSPAESPRTDRKRPSARETPVHFTLDELVGAHPLALRDIYASGEPALPDDFGAGARGRLLAVERLGDVHALTSPAVAFVARRLVPWQGKVFESGGTAGANRVLGRSIFRFRCEAGASLIDGAPTLFLRYDGLGNPYPISHVVDELRAVGRGLAIGPAFLESKGGHALLFWWGLES